MSNEKFYFTVIFVIFNAFNVEMLNAKSNIFSIYGFEIINKTTPYSLFLKKKMYAMKI